VVWQFKASLKLKRCQTVKKIKPVALAIVELQESEEISQAVSQSVSQSVSQAGRQAGGQLVKNSVK